MKSLCIKTNNSFILDYLLEELEKLNIDNTYITIKELKHFNNIILHCKNADVTQFINSISNILTKAIISFFEKDLIKDLVNLNYFYFNSLERNTIIHNTLEMLNNDNNLHTKYDFINNQLFDYLSSSHSIYLKGFVDFRLKNYIHFINEKIDLAVNQFLIDKEYLEFVNILRVYIKAESSTSNIQHLHLIYYHKNSFIIDDNKEIVSCNDNITKAKYISDISFSSNDLALNTLLNLLPQRITIHLIDGYVDEFINTIKLIFQDRVKICEDCDICELYRYKEKNK